MDTLSFTIDIPDEKEMTLSNNDFVFQLFSSNIRNEIRETVQKKILEELAKQKTPTNKANTILADALDSSALFAVTNPFALQEYIKNTHDAGGTKIQIFIHIDLKNQTVKCILTDNGKGIARESSISTPLKERSFLNYKQDVLKGQKGLQSHKQQLMAETKQQQTGGAGKGLAITSKAIELGNGKIEISNRKALSTSNYLNGKQWPKADTMKKQLATSPKGIALLFSSPFCSPDIRKNAAELAKSITREQLINNYRHGYINQLMKTESADNAIEHSSKTNKEDEASPIKLIMPVFSSSDEKKSPELTSSERPNQFINRPTTLSIQSSPSQDPDSPIQIISTSTPTPSPKNSVSIAADDAKMSPETPDINTEPTITKVEKKPKKGRPPTLQLKETTSSMPNKSSIFHLTETSEDSKNPIQTKEPNKSPKGSK